MKISKFQIYNYKSFSDSGSVNLSNGFNIITGQNNVGKTALLQALSLRFQSHPHRSLARRPIKGAAYPENPSSIDLTFDTSGHEVERLVSRLPQVVMSLPEIAIQPNLFRGSEILEPGNLVNAEKFWAWFVGLNHLSLQLGMMGNPDGQWYARKQPSHGLFAVNSNNRNALPTFIRLRDEYGNYFFRQQASSWIDVGQTLGPGLASQVFRFAAERIPQGEFPYGDNSVLEQNARNLPEVLNKLQSNSAAFEEFIRSVSYVLPLIRWISVSAQGAQNRILVWPVDRSTKREDLAIPLSESGTGVGQVLALLYVVITSDFPQVILIDEPQSFLHPGAARKLIEVLKLYPQHQYVIATHSPSVISIARPDEIIILRNQESETRVEIARSSEKDTVTDVFGELGVRLSDVFGMDRILWVEGATEEAAFPLVLDHFSKTPRAGTAILGIRQTGDLQAKDAERVFEIYNKLSSAPSLLPPALAFILDDEQRSLQNRRELERRSGGKVYFLPRRMYENYLLVPHAIAQVMNGCDGFREEPIQPDEVIQAIESKRTAGKYIESSSANWIKEVDAGRFLQDLFTEMSNTRVSYRKTLHSIQLTKWILEHSPDELKEIAELLEKVLAISAETP